MMRSASCVLVLWLAISLVPGDALGWKITPKNQWASRCSGIFAGYKLGVYWLKNIKAWGRTKICTGYVHWPPPSALHLDFTKPTNKNKCTPIIGGYTVGEPMTFMSGDIYHPVDTKLKDATLLKYGSQTGLTRGGFVLQGASIRKSTFNEFENKFGFCLHDQIMVVPTGPLPFADHGDSGALVLAKMDDSEYLQAIGIVSGGASDKTTVFVTPILPILEALDLNQQLKLFQSPMEEDTVANNTTNHARLLNERLEHIEQRVDGIEKNISGQRKEMNDFKKELSDKQDKHTQILLSAIASSKTNS